MLELLLVAALSSGQMGGVDLLYECTRMTNDCRRVLWETAEAQGWPDTVMIKDQFGHNFLICPTGNAGNQVVKQTTYDMMLPVKFIEYWRTQDPSRLLGMTATEAAEEAFRDKFTDCYITEGS